MSYKDPNSKKETAFWLSNVALALFIGYIMGKF